MGTLRPEEHITQDKCWRHDLGAQIARHVSTLRVNTMTYSTDLGLGGPTWKCTCCLACMYRHCMQTRSRNPQILGPGRLIKIVWPQFALTQASRSLCSTSCVALHVLTPHANTIASTDPGPWRAQEGRPATVCANAGRRQHQDAPGHGRLLAQDASDTCADRDAFQCLLPGASFMRRCLKCEVGGSSHKLHRRIPVVGWKGLGT